MGNKCRRRKCSMKKRRLSIKRLQEVMRARKNANKTNETSQDPVVGNTDIQHATEENENMKCKVIKEKIDIVFEPEETEETEESADGSKQNIYESGNDAPCETQSSEELWVVRRQLCRGCHFDGAFWSLQSKTEGDSYEHLIQTYLNIQLCPVAEDEHALSAICTLCAARLREARAFSAQAHAAEEHFTRFYKQNRVRALNQLAIQQDVPKIKNEVDELEIINDDEPDTADSNLDNPESSIDELVPTLKNDKKTQEQCQEPASKDLLRHSPAHYERVGNLFKCTSTHCDVKMYTWKGIQDHLKKVHGKSLKYTCLRCDKTLSTLSEFKSHQKYSHSNMSPSDFERVGNSYKCTRCEKLFKLYSHVRNHVMYKHLKVPRYTCPNCDKTFHSLSSFIKHKLEEHSIDDRIKCNACDWSTYRNNAALTMHKDNFHMLGVKIFCKDCDYSSYSQYSMKKHAIKHSTVKEHHCKFCKKSFLRKSNLNFHERIHTGDKRKVCNVCGEAFVQRASLKYHMVKHHPEVRD